MLPDIIGPDHYSSVLRLFAMTDSANLIKRRIASEREGLRSFAADAHDCIMIQVLESGFPLISSRQHQAAPSCSKPSRCGLAEARRLLFCLANLKPMPADSSPSMKITPACSNAYVVVLSSICRRYFVF